MCHDFTFWKAETGRCIPKKLNYDAQFKYYTFPPLCNRTEFGCMDTHYPTFANYCPNKDESCESYDHFLCNSSKTCIPKGELI